MNNTIVGQLIGMQVEYRNKKIKWLSGRLLSVNVEANTCTLLNKFDETVTAKLSTSVRVPG